jgi:hypothetical protein
MPIRPPRPCVRPTGNSGTKQSDTDRPSFFSPLPRFVARPRITAPACRGSAKKGEVTTPSLSLPPFFGTTPARIEPVRKASLPRSGGEGSFSDILEPSSSGAATNNRPSARGVVPKRGVVTTRPCHYPPFGTRGAESLSGKPLSPCGAEGRKICTTLAACLALGRYNEKVGATTSFLFLVAGE